MRPTLILTIKIAAAVSILAGTIAAQTSATVETKDRNVYYLGADGGRLQLTSSFSDLFPSLSPDGKHVAFIRFGVDGPPGAEGDETTRICVVRVAALEPPPDCDSVKYQEGEDNLAGFKRPLWTPDSKAVYFLADFSRTTGGLCRFDLETGKAHFVSPVEEFAVVRTGAWQGLALARIYQGPTMSDSGAKTSYPYFVLSPTGDKLAQVGQDGEKMEAVLARVEKQKSR